MKFFSMDSPLMQALNKMADLLWLNVLALICCLPVVTVGASMTAMHYMALKIARNEETYITKGFLKSFKENFRQATIIWLLQLTTIIVLLGDYYILFFSEMEFHTVLQVMLYLVTIIVLLVSIFVYPVLARFDNTVFKTIKNALYIGILQLPKAVLMLAMYIAPLILTVVATEIFPIIFLFGLSLPAFVSAKLYHKFFLKLEDKVLENSASDKEDLGSEDEHIFSDELDPALTAGEEFH
ncbi:MAG: DUF624 domain-containing protein [Roseburia sp.]|nr:DUF624 domain-containing protein [Roseburia sp.]